MATVGRGADQYTVRFPDGLRDRIKAAADANNRSMNAEIVATLEEKYPSPQEFDPVRATLIIRELRTSISILKDPERTLKEKIAASNRFDALKAEFERMASPAPSNDAP